MFSKTAKKVAGGISGVTKMLLQSFLAEVPNILDGFAVCSARPVLVRARFGPTLQDEVAMKFAWSVKGHAGLKPCLHCSNVLMKEHPLLVSDDSLCDISEHDVSKFVLASNNEIWNAQDYLREQKLIGNPRMGTLEKCCGQNYDPEGLLASRLLRGVVQPAESLWDPMHVFFSDGICRFEIDLLVKGLRSIGLLHSRLMDFCNHSGWQMHGSKANLEFSKDGLKGGAS